MGNPSAVLARSRLHYGIVLRGSHFAHGSEQLIKASSPMAWHTVLSSPTTDANLQCRLLQFATSDLSQTLQDAITLINALGVRYVWIDSICVPRGTWDDEASKMHEVYGNAYFTLSISSATKATDRILQDHPSSLPNLEN